MSEKEPTSFYYVIPGEVMHDPDLTIYEKMLYGLISGLSNKYGHCFASNEWIGKIIGLQERQIQRYLKKMEMAGYLRREIRSDDENPFKKYRYIYINTYFKKSLPSVSHDSSGMSSMTASDMSSMTGIISEENTLISEDTHTPPSKASANAVRACKFFIEKIKEVNPKFKDPNLEKWENEFDCILQIDKRDVEELCDMIQWVFNHDFWKSRCLSPGNLRKQFDSIYMQRQSETKMNASEDNKSFAIALKKKYPDKLKNLTISPKYAMKLDSGKELPFSLPIETFRNALCQMFGGRYEPNPESGKDSDVEHTE